MYILARRSVQWCGDIAHAALKKAGVDVPVTMCNGETATNAINTCNGNDCSGFLEQHGQNGRVLVDQPALWTENEGGFQTWGGAPPPGGEPYFWGRSMADQSLSVMKWFARGGSHMNYCKVWPSQQCPRGRGYDGIRRRRAPSHRSLTVVFGLTPAATYINR